MPETKSKTKDMKLVVVTPEATVLDVFAEFVTVPLYDGEAGIAVDHAPMIGRLGFGQLRYRHGGESGKYYVDGGFVQVNDNVVSVLTNRAMLLSEIDVDGAKSQLKDALGRKPSNPEEMAIRDRLVSQARAQMRLAGATE